MIRCKRDACNQGRDPCPYPDDCQNESVDHVADAIMLVACLLSAAVVVSVVIWVARSI